MLEKVDKDSILKDAFHIGDMDEKCTQIYRTLNNTGE